MRLSSLQTLSSAEFLFRKNRPASGGVDALLLCETLAGLDVTGKALSGGPFDTEAGYRFPVFGGGFTGTLHLGFGASDRKRDCRFAASTSTWRSGSKRDAASTT